MLAPPPVVVPRLACGGSAEKEAALGCDCASAHHNQPAETSLNQWGLVGDQSACGDAHAHTCALVSARTRGVAEAKAGCQVMEGLLLEC